MKKSRILLPFTLLSIMAITLGLGVGIIGESQPSCTDVAISSSFELSSYTTLENILIDGNEDFHTQASSNSWPGDGSEETPYVISNYILTGVSIQPIQIWNVDLHWEFRNNFIETGAVCGSLFKDTSNGLIANNTFHHRWNGMVLENVESIIIEDNVVEDNGYNGITVTGSAIDCVFQNNIVRRVDKSGISIPTAINCQVKNNNISDTNSHGIMIVSSEESEISGNIIDSVSINGMALSQVNNGTVTDNLITNCPERGIWLAGGEGTVIRGNRMENCDSYGILLGTSTLDTTARQNVLVDNGGTCQVCDDGTDNVVVYNYYDDWTTPDANSDGIVDVPYDLDGDASNQDPYPLTAPDVDPPASSTTTTSTTTSTQTSTTTTMNTEPLTIPPEMFLIAGAGVIVVIVIVAIAKRK